MSADLHEPKRLAHRLAWLSFAAAMLLAPALAGAQLDTRPKLYIVFDTSGSMLWHQGATGGSNDGSALCGCESATPPAACANGKLSRVYQLRKALFEVLQGIGTSEIDFALATFPQEVRPNATPGCPRGHFFTTPIQNSGCKISTHDDTVERSATCATTACPWYQAYKEEVLRVPFGSQAQDMLRWVDGLEDGDSIPPLNNPEIRASGPTPLGHSLFYAYGYFDKEVVLPASDYRKKCEKLTIALFTDGDATCSEGKTSGFYPRDWAAALRNQLGVRVNTVGIDHNSLNLAAIATSGGGNYVQVVGNSTALKTALLDLIAKSQPATELCNGADDDCDNDVDEDFPLKGKSCTNGKLGTCFRAGVYVCKADGSGVECDAPDVQGGEEICNALDDDCDGKVDEDIPGGCAPCTPQLEICNGKSDDCDAEIDEDIPSVACGSSLGQCIPGKTQCINGQLICEGAQGPQPERCNGLDDDCDGIPDGFSEACYSFAKGCDPATGICQGACRMGSRNCPPGSPGQPGGLWTPCQGSVGPGEEICDGLDNNCDGLVDEGAECPGGGQCLAGGCAIACGGVEFGCPAGFVCQNGWCITDPCKGMTCGQNEVCKAGLCVDVCANRTCKSWEKCVQGRCEDQTCYNPKFACPSDQKCIGGVCAKDPCAGVECGAAEYCFQGECRSICENMTCGQGQRCENGRCIADPCAGLDCKPVEVCVKNVDGQGVCLSNPCIAAPECPKGQTCVVSDKGEASCVGDPCEVVTCPSSHRCVDGQCTTGVVGNTHLLATGSGGVACGISASPGDVPSPPYGLLLVLLTLLPIWRRRRRPR